MLISWLVEKYKQVVAFAFISYLLSSIYSANQLIKAGYSSNGSYQYLDVTILAVLFGTVWLLLAESSSRIYLYSLSIKQLQESRAFFFLSKALTVLTLSLMITAFLNIFRIPPVNNLYGVLTVMIYYFSAVFSVTYFYYLGQAGRLFARQVNRNKYYLTGLVFITVVLNILCLLIWTQISAADQTVNNPNHILNYLSSRAAFILFLLPLVVAWAYGLAGAWGVFLYQRFTPGLVYKPSMTYLTIGIVLLFVVSSSRHLSDFTLGSTAQVSLVNDFGRVVVLFALLILALSPIRLGVIKLTRIENI